MSTRMATAPQSAAANDNGSANEEQLDEIRESLNRIEDVLNRGQHVLYDDEAEGGEPADAGAVAQPSAAPADSNTNGHAYHSYHSTPLKRSVAGGTVSPDHHHRSPVIHPPIAPRRGTGAAEPAVAASPYQAAHDAAHRRPSGSATRARTAPGVHSSATRRHSNSKEEEISASARARQIEEIKRTSGRVPNFEEGVDDNDMAQNTSIEDLKERIRRELEEYHRNGPLMHRRASYQRKQRSSTVPRTSAAVSRPSAAKPATATSAGTSSALPPPPPSRPAAKSSKVRTPKRITPSPSPAAPADTRAAPTRSVPRKVAATTAAKPRARTAGPPASRTAHTTTTTNAPAAKPFWERLYRDAATQQEKRDQQAEQRRIEQEAARFKSIPRRRAHRPPAHTTYSAYYRNLQSNGESATQSREMSANRSRTGGASSNNVPAQHSTYVPRRAPSSTTASAANASRNAAAKPPAGAHSASGAPAHVAARRPSAQPAARKPAGASTPPVPLPLGPGLRAAAPEPVHPAPPRMPKLEAQKRAEEPELRVPPAAPEARATPPPDNSRDRSREPFGDEPESRGQSEEVEPCGAAATTSSAHNVRPRNSDSDSDSEPEEVQQKSTPHPYVAPLDLSGIKK